MILHYVSQKMIFSATNSSVRKVLAVYKLLEVLMGQHIKLILQIRIFLC